MYQILLDPLAVLRLHATLGRHVDVAADDLFKAQVDSGEIEQVERTPHVDEHVDVAVRPGLVAGDRAEQRDRCHAHRVEFSAMLGQQLDGLTPSHR
jgi:hypothetical protein